MMMTDYDEQKIIKMWLFDSVRFSEGRRAAVGNREERLGRARCIGMFRGLRVTNYNKIY